MIALITGASSGIGRDMARYLGEKGYNLILVARDREKLEKLKEEIQTEVTIICMDLSIEENLQELHKQAGDIDILINNAGFGLFGEFDKTDLEIERKMIETNVIAVHNLTKLFLKDMKKKNNGYILNVASIAGFMPGGPLMSTYYATKSYILSLSKAIAEELRKQKSKVKISVLCPGPVDTEFAKVAGVRFKTKAQTSEYVARFAIEKMLKGREVIIPGIKIKAGRLLSKLLPDKLIIKILYRIQKARK